MKRYIFKLESGCGYDSKWSLKPNFPDEEVTPERVGQFYGEGEFIVVEDPEILVIERTSTYVLAAKKDFDDD